MEDVAFGLLSAVCLGSALLVVSRKNPIYALLYLTVFFLGLTGLFVMLSAPFVAAIQVIVYVGAILVLFLFVLTLLDVRGFGGEEGRNLASFLPGLVVSAGLGLGLCSVIYVASGDQRSPGGELEVGFGSTEAIARHLYGRFGLALELVSVLILAALVGAVVIARRRARSAAPAPGRATVEI